MREIKRVIVKGCEYTKEDLMKMDPVLLRALLHERAHHSIEVPLYGTLAKWKGKPITGFGAMAQMVFDAWRERGLPEDDPDIKWVKQYIAIAKKIRKGGKIEWKEPLPEPFTEKEMSIVRKLLWGRHSIRNWTGESVPDWMIEQILEAGRAAPIGCNLDELRFIVIKDSAEHRLIWSDIPTEDSVLIVICYDTRIAKVVGQEFIPQNPGYDAAAAADHMLLMAHALGLGGVWLTKRAQTRENLIKHWGMPEYMEHALHIAIGWTALGTIKTQRMPLADMMLQRND